MASTINGTSTGSGGLVSTGDDSGILNIQTNETTAITVDASQIVSYTNNLGTVAGYPAYQCRAWVNFNGIGTVAIRGSGNISSITDNGTGQYTLNFSTAMPDVNYTLGAFAQEDTGGGLRVCQGYGTPTASARPVETRNSSNTLADCGWVNVIIVR